MDKDLLCNQAVKIFGNDHQILIAVEEASELIQALTNFKDRATYKQVTEEIADVIIMIKQMSIIFDEELVNLALEEKLSTNYQIGIDIVEAAELIQVLMHFRRGRATYKQVVGKIADVIILIKQMSIIFGEELVNLALEEKLSKLKSLIDINSDINR